MRVALCMVVMPRTMEYCFPSQKAHILDVYSPDVFIGTSAKDVTGISLLYNPVKIESIPEDEIVRKAGDLRKGKVVIPFPPSILPGTYKLKMAMELKRIHEAQNGFTYDVVIITRDDVKITYIEPITEVAPNTLYVPRIGAYWDTPPAEPGIHWGGHSMQLCWMSSEVADRIAHIYYEEEDWYKRSVESSPDWGHTSEYLFRYYCEQNRIRVQLVDINMMLIRGTSNAPLAYNNQPLTLYPEYAI